MADAWNEMLARYAEIRDLENALSILGWDQEVVMPPGGTEARAHSLAALTGAIHGRLTDPRLRQLVRQRASTPARRRALHLVARKVEKAACIPLDLARELALAESRGLERWKLARQRKDFSIFAPALGHIVDLKRQVARLSAKGGRLYDALLDDFEPGATVASMDALLIPLKQLTVPLVERLGRNGKCAFVGRFEVGAQRAFAEAVVTAMGIDLSRGRMDLSTHPFCGGVAPDDVRMTSRFDPRDLRGGLFGVVHEAGHGLYEQGQTRTRARDPLGGAVSMALHESQSRLWENFVARGRPFWKHWLPRLKKTHPQLRRLDLEGAWRAANVMGPSFIRVEADELTYNLHIVLRYEIERDLIEGRQSVAGLPARWNREMEANLGMRPRDDAQGVLQDIHWASGLFGYFPTYSVGNLYAAQFMEAARAQMRGLDGRIARGDLAPLRTWLQRNIHRHDQLYTAEQLVKRVTGRPLSVDAFARHITAKVDALHG